MFLDVDWSTRWNITGNSVQDVLPDDYSEGREWRLSESGLRVQIPGRIEADENLAPVHTSLHILTEEEVQAPNALSSNEVDWPAALGTDIPVRKHQDVSGKGYVGFVYMRPCLRLWVPERPYAKVKHVTQVIVGVYVEGTLHNIGTPVTGTPNARVGCTVGHRRVELRCNAAGPTLRLTEGNDLKQVARYISSTWLMQAQQSPERWRILFVKTSGTIENRNHLSSLSNQKAPTSSQRRKDSDGNKLEPWTCSVCQLENEQRSTKCASCGTEPVVASNSAESEVDGAWICEWCTNPNADDLFVCEVCDAPRPDETPGSKKKYASTRWTHGPLVDPLVERVPPRNKNSRAKCKLQNEIETGKLGRPLLGHLGKAHNVPNGIFSLFERHKLLEKIDLGSGDECHQIVWALKECAPIFQDDGLWPVFVWLVSVMVLNLPLRREWAREHGEEGEAEKRPFVPLAWLAIYLLKLWPTVGSGEKTFLVDAASRFARGKPWTKSITLDEMKNLFTFARGRFIILEKCLLNGDVKLALFFLRRTPLEVLRARWEIPNLADRTMPPASFFLLYDKFLSTKDHQAPEELVALLANAYSESGDFADALRAFVERADCPKQNKRDFIIGFASALRIKEDSNRKKEVEKTPVSPRKKEAPKSPKGTPGQPKDDMGRLVMDIFIDALAARKAKSSRNINHDDCKELLEASLMLGDGNSFSNAWVKKVKSDRLSLLKKFMRDHGAKYVGMQLRAFAARKYNSLKREEANGRLLPRFPSEDGASETFADESPAKVMTDRPEGCPSPSRRDCMSPTKSERMSIQASLVLKGIEGSGEVEELLADRVKWTHDHFGSRYFSEKAVAPRRYKDVAQLMRMYIKLDLGVGNVALWTFIQEMERDTPCKIGSFNVIAPELKALRGAIAEDVHKMMCPTIAEDYLQVLLGYSAFFDPLVQSFIQGPSFKLAQMGMERDDLYTIVRAVIKVMSLVGCKNVQTPEDVCTAIANMAKTTKISGQFVCNLCSEVLRRSPEDFNKTNGDNGFNTSNLHECCRRLQVACQVIEYKVKAGRVNKEKLLESVHHVVDSFQESPPYIWESYFGSLDTIIFFIEYMGKEDLELTYKKLEEDLANSVNDQSSEKEKLANAQLKELLACVKTMYTKPLVKISADNLTSMQQLNIAEYIKENAPRRTEDVEWNGIVFTPADWDDVLEIAGITARSMQEKFNVLMLPHHTQMITLIMFAIRACGVGGAPGVAAQLPLTMLARVGTGEGKSWVIGMLAAFIARRGERTVGGLRAHVVIDNVTLKSRDFDTVKMFFDKLGIKASEREEDLSSQEHKVVYCTGADIWSQCRQRQEAGDLAGFEESLCNTILIVDEVDGLILDGDANIQYMYPDQRMSVLADQWCRQLENAIEPTVVQDKDMDPITFEENKLCLERVLEAYEEAKNATLGKDFEWRGGNMYMIDKTTGMLAIGFWDLWFEIRHWIEKEWEGWVTYKCIKGVLCKKHCFTAYPSIFGLTGSLGQKAEKDYLAAHYNAVSFNVPFFLETCRSEDSILDTSKPKLKKVNQGADVVLRDADEQMKKVVALAVAKCKEVPVLIIAKDMAKVEETAKRLEKALGAASSRSSPYSANEDSVLAGRERVIRLVETPGHPQRFVKLVDLATQPWDLGDAKGKGRTWRITITTAEGGRGHDYRVVDPGVDAAGGMLLILMWVSWSEREWIQFLGRTSRQDHQGQYAVFLDEQSSDLQELADAGKEIHIGHEVVSMILSAGDDKMKAKFSKIGDEILRGTLMHKLTARYWSSLQDDRSTTTLQESVWRKLCREYLQPQCTEDHIVREFNRHYPLEDEDDEVPMGMRRSDRSDYIAQPATLVGILNKDNVDHLRGFAYIDGMDRGEEDTIPIGCSRRVANCPETVPVSSCGDCRCS